MINYFLFLLTPFFILIILSLSVVILSWSVSTASKFLIDKDG